MASHGSTDAAADREERLRGAFFAIGSSLDDGRDEAPQEAGNFEQRGPEVVEAVDQQALDVGPARDAVVSRLGPNGLKIEEATTHDLLSRRRRASMA